MPDLQTLMDHLGRIAPLELAASWDNVGLLLGERGQEVTRVMTCLTVTPASAAEAVREKANLIVSHHPILFKGAKQLTDGTPDGRILLPLLRAGVAVYSPHTAFDNAPGGINDMIASSLGLEEVTPLRNLGSPGQCKLVVFVPEADLGKVCDALFAEGAGEIGDYRECSYRLLGTGTFYGTESTNPTVGQKGRREEVQEWRIEVVCPEKKVERIVQAMRKAHSYEEPAFDIYPLKALPSGSGEGRVGTLQQAIPLQQLVERIARELHASAVQTVGKPDRMVQRVAIVCGAGGDFIRDAARAKADVFLTGEARFHDCLAAEERGIAMVLPGHYATERPGIEMLARRLQADWPDLHVWASKDERDPLRTTLS